MVDYVAPNNLHRFHQEISNLIDIAIVNEKQKNALMYEIEKLLHQYFLFELPEYDGDENDN